MEETAVVAGRVLPSILLANNAAFFPGFLPLYRPLARRSGRCEQGRTHRLLAFHNQLVHLVELADHGLSLQSSQSDPLFVCWERRGRQKNPVLLPRLSVKPHLHHSQILESILDQFLDLPVLRLILMLAEGVPRAPAGILAEVVVRKLGRLAK